MPGYDINDLKRRMDSAIDVLKKEFSGIRSGRANVNFLEPVSVNAYGQTMKLRDLSTVSAPEARMINIQVWDSANVSVVEKAIHEADLGLNPQIEGQIIRIILPELTEERRLILIKQIKNEGEKGKISIRSSRKESNEYIKKLSNDGASEDEIRTGEDQIQKITNSYIKKIDNIIDIKEKELITI